MAVSFNQRVVGSIPTALTNKIKDLIKGTQNNKTVWITPGYRTSEMPAFQAKNRPRQVLCALLYRGAGLSAKAPRGCS